MTQCVQCQGRSNNAYLCARCCAELRSLLDGLAIGNPLGNGRRSRPWLVCLQDAAEGSTRLGESARRATDQTQPMPFNERASDELGKVENMLSTWVRHICETRGVEVPA